MRETAATRTREFRTPMCSPSQVRAIVSPSSQCRLPFSFSLLLFVLGAGYRRRARACNRLRPFKILSLSLSHGRSSITMVALSPRPLTQRCTLSERSCATDCVRPLVRSILRSAVQSIPTPAYRELDQSASADRSFPRRPRLLVAVALIPSRRSAPCARTIACCC